MRAIVGFFVRLYCAWGRLYRRCERARTGGHGEMKSAIRKRIELMSFGERVNFIIGGMRYRKDTAGMLGDVMSDPYVSLHEGGDDCDGYASVGYVVFGEKFQLGSRTFEFDGFYSVLFDGLARRLLKRESTGHMIAVWAAQDGTCFAVSTEYMRMFENRREIKSHLDSLAQGWMYSRLRPRSGPEFDVEFDRAYTAAEFEKAFR